MQNIDSTEQISTPTVMETSIIDETYLPRSSAWQQPPFGNAASWQMLDTVTPASWLTNVDIATLFAQHHIVPDSRKYTNNTAPPNTALQDHPSVTNDVNAHASVSLHHGWNDRTTDESNSPQEEEILSSSPHLSFASRTSTSDAEMVSSSPCQSQLPSRHLFTSGGGKLGGMELVGLKSLDQNDAVECISPGRVNPLSVYSEYDDSSISTQLSSQLGRLDEWLSDPSLMIPSQPQELRQVPQYNHSAGDRSNQDNLSLFHPISMDFDSPRNSLSSAFGMGEQRTYEPPSNDEGAISTISPHRAESGKTMNPLDCSIVASRLKSDPLPPPRHDEKMTEEAIVGNVVQTGGFSPHVDALEQREGRYPCPHPYCFKDFSTGGHARRHSRIHSSQRPFVCPREGCQATFNRRDNCVHHQRRVHQC